MKVFFINLSWGVGVSLHAFCRKKKQDKKNIHDVFYKLTAHKHKIFFSLTHSFCEQNCLNDFV